MSTYVCDNCGKPFPDWKIGREHEATCPDLMRNREIVFTNCNVCGRKLHNDTEESMGMCQGCADE
jgi:DNA-directed RNA polymerase subunit RPC12/RpoP